MKRTDANLSAQDIERLSYALGKRRIDASRSLFGPHSLTWRVNREGLLLLGGGRALLLQVAHPLVAAGVAAHSAFKQDPLQRLQRTLDLTLQITFSDAAGALRAVRAIEQRHAQVRGTLRESAGPFEAGTPYDAADPRLLFWVHATLVDTSLVIYERFFHPLTLEERMAYYEESKVVARLFGIPEKLIPLTLDAFDEYMRVMFSSDELAVSSESKEIAEAILNPPLPIGLRQGARSTNIFTIGLLPPLLRERYGFGWNPAWELALSAIAATTRNSLPHLPGALRYWPHARRAIAEAAA